MTKITTLNLSGTNCYLIGSKSEYILIDTGYEHDWDIFCKELKSAGVSPAEISHIVLTHHHDDHCGLLNKILEKNNKIRIVMSVLAEDLLLKGRNSYPPGSGMINRRIVLLWHLKYFYLSQRSGKKLDKTKNLTFPPYRARECDILIKNEIRLKDIGINLSGRIIETPGHSIDSITVLLDGGDCFAGDAAANLLRFAGTKYCIIGMYDLDEYYKSWEKMISGNAKLIYPAHGKPFRIEKLKENIRKNKQKNMIVTK